MHRPMPRTRFLVSTMLMALVTGAALLQQGCYRRVVGVRGLGGSTYDVSEPYQQNSKVDDWLFGEQHNPNDKIKPPPAHE
jgi:hypothetical protein